MISDWSFLDTPSFSWVLLPFLIFLSRICDVTIGTIRVMVLTRGIKLIVPVLAFFEVLIWLLAIRQMFVHMNNIVCYLAYAGGFAMGNYVGIIVEERFAMGFEIIRVIARQDGHKLVELLRSRGYGVTSVNAQGATGDVQMIHTIIKRREHHKVIEIIRQFNVDAFYSVEDVRSVSRSEFLSEKTPTFLSS
jgi:uncharacterized protein YebE (UPF0316 family)